MRTRTLIIGIAFSFAIAAGGYFAERSVIRADMRDAHARVEFQNALRTHENTIGEAKKRALGARTLSEWEDVLALAATLPEEAKRHFTVRAHVGMLEALADERDRLLWNAGVLYRANERDPGIGEAIAKARTLHERIEVLLKQVETLSDTNAGFAFYMRSAYERYRSLAFLDPKAAALALETIREAVQLLKAANMRAPKQNDAEIAIEFLYKRTKDEEQKLNAGDQTRKQPRALPPDRRRGPARDDDDVPGRERRH